MRRRAGFSLTEIVVVCGIVGVLASLVLPALAETRTKARLSQCTSNLRQLGQALVMYDTDHNRHYENYPDRLTHLYDLGYARDTRIFICPMDPTKATTSKNGRTALKPIFEIGVPYSTQVPKDDKADWAERAWILSNSGDRAIRELNCSYLYEFSTRTLQTWSGTRYPDGSWDTVQWNGSGWASDVLVDWYDYMGPPTADYVYEWEDTDIFTWTSFGVAANPRNVDRDGDFVVTWQEAKFHQLENGDIFITGMYTPGERNLPVTWSWDPYERISAGEYPPQRGYGRAWMPIVRCFYHQTPAEIDYENVEEVLNLAIDGNTFYSVPGWENTYWKYSRQMSAEDW
jgi:prepilin-type N-terminal cleavage/methylation domain-containing protein